MGGIHRGIGDHFSQGWDVLLVLKISAPAPGSAVVLRREFCCSSGCGLWCPPAGYETSLLLSEQWAVQRGGVSLCILGLFPLPRLPYR